MMTGTAQAPTTPMTQSTLTQLLQQQGANANPGIPQSQAFAGGQGGGFQGNHLYYLLSQFFPKMFGGGAQYDVGNFGPGGLGAKGPGGMGGGGLGAAGAPSAGVGGSSIGDLINFGSNAGAGAITGGFNPLNLLKGAGGGIASILSGLFGNSGAGYQEAMDAYNKYIKQGEGQFNPYTQAGQRATSNLEAQLALMKDPQAFVNNILKGYSMSPEAQKEQQYGQQGIQNAASASGLLGSSPLFASAADYAKQFSTNDMQRYLQNVLGVNTEYLGGQNQLSNRGLQAASALADLLRQQAEANAMGEYGKASGHQSDINKIFSGIGSLFGF